MKRLFLLPALLFALGCGSTSKDASMASVGTSGSLIGTMHHVVDRKTEARIGLIEEHRYSDGRTVYWVKDLHDVRRGFILPNNSAYAYEWVGGKRNAEPTFIGADTISSNARRLLGYTHPVALQETTLEAVVKERIGDRYTDPSQAAAVQQPADEEDEGDGDDGCGCGDE